MTRPEILIFHALLLLVSLAPLPLGSNRDWSWSLVAFCTAVLAILWVLARLLAARPLAARQLHPAIPLLFLLALAWAWLQTVAWMPLAWKHPAWQLAEATLNLPLSGSISLSPVDTFTAVMRTLSYGLVFFLGFQIAQDRLLARRALWWIFITGVIYSFYGMLSYFGVMREVMWYQDDAYGQDVRATFVNRNHFATWVGLCLMCALGAFFDHMFRAPSYPMLSLQRRQRGFDHFMARSWLPLSGLILLVSALVSSHSRGGFLGTLSGSVLLLVLIDRKRGQVSTRVRAVIAAAVLISAVSFFISSELLLERFDRSAMDAQGRTLVYQQVSAAIADNPLLGFGYGAFEDGFRLYRTEAISKLIDRAHNTYLENIFELGIVAAVCQVLALLGLLLTCLRGVKIRERAWIYPAVGVAATAVVGVHALMDFSLQIPAVAILYSCIMGIACAQSFSSRDG